jgi:hypothetical protein
MVPARLTAIALALVAMLVAGCAAGAPTSSPWTLYSPAPLATPVPTPSPALAPTPVPSPSDEPVAEDTPPPPVCPDFLPPMPVRIADFVSIDPACFLSTRIVMVGYVSASPALGWEAPGVEPGWMIYPSTPMAVWQEKPIDYGCGSAPDCPWIFVHFPPGSSLTLGTRGRWVKLTGHVNDPAAASCHYVYPPDWDATELLPDSDAQRWCSEGFVVEKIETTTAP